MAAKTSYRQTFASLEEERLHRKVRLAAAFRLFGQFGFDEGVAGHITARDPEHLDHFWVNPFGMNFSHIRVSDLILVNDRGEVVEGDADGQHRRVRDPLARSTPPDPTSSPRRTPTRSTASRGRRSAGCSIRSRRTCARSTTTTRCSTTTPAWCSTLEEGKRIAHALGDNKAVILRNHGLLTVGHSVDEAAWWFITMERSCQAQLLAEAAGTPVLIDPDMAKLTASQVGSHVAGHFSFQPLYDKITREQPDLFD